MQFEGKLQEVINQEVKESRKQDQQIIQELEKKNYELEMKKQNLEMKKHELEERISFLEKVIKKLSGATVS